MLTFSGKKWNRNFLGIYPKYLDSLSKCSRLALTNCLLYVYYTQCITKKKWWNRTLLVICTSTHLVLNAYKVSCNSVQRFKRICAYKVVTTVFNIWPNSKFKRDNIPIKIMESEFPSYYTSRQCALHTHNNLYHGSNDHGLSIICIHSVALKIFLFIMRLFPLLYIINIL